MKNVSIRSETLKERKKKSLISQINFSKPIEMQHFKFEKPTYMAFIYMCSKILSKRVVDKLRLSTVILKEWQCLSVSVITPKYIQFNCKGRE